LTPALGTPNQGQTVTVSSFGGTGRRGRTRAGGGRTRRRRPRRSMGSDLALTHFPIREPEEVATQDLTPPRSPIHSANAHDRRPERCPARDTSERSEEGHLA